MHAFNSRAKNKEKRVYEMKQETMEKTQRILKKEK